MNANKIQIHIRDAVTTGVLFSALVFYITLRPDVNNSQHFIGLFILALSYGALKKSRVSIALLLLTHLAITPAFYSWLHPVPTTLFFVSGIYFFSQGLRAAFKARSNLY